MNWSEICQTYVNQWLVVEALKAHTTSDHQRWLEELAVIEICTSGNEAMKKYQHFHQQYPYREFYFVHTSQEKLDIRERQWFGIKSCY
jgi:hypothetical protein